MPDKKMAPRVGDRVLVKVYNQHRTASIEQTVDKYVFVRLDAAIIHPDSSAVAVDRFDLASGWGEDAEITVLSRQWPEGWANGSTYCAYHISSGTDFTRTEIEHVIATGPDMLARWHELKEEN